MQQTATGRVTFQNDESVAAVECGSCSVAAAGISAPLAAHLDEQSSCYAALACRQTCSREGGGSRSIGSRGRTPFGRFLCILQLHY
jgi:hypothetical protein